MMVATGYFKVLVPGAHPIDEVVPFDGRDLESVQAAWARAVDMRRAAGTKALSRWGAIQVEGPWSRVPRIDL